MVWRITMDNIIFVLQISEPIVQVLGTKPSPLGAMSSCELVHCRIFCPNGWKVDPTTGCAYCACKEI